MGSAALFFRLILRPMSRERGRSLLILVAVALGVAVVLAIELASSAAAGSFRSSMETLSGDSDLEVTATGGVPVAVLGTLAKLPFPLHLSARIEDHASIIDTGETVPLIGLDLISEADQHASGETLPSMGTTDLAEINDPSSVWVTRDLKKKAGDRLRLLINDTPASYAVRGVLPRSERLASSAIVMDIGAAQTATGKSGRLDRILIKLPDKADPDAWTNKLRAQVPQGIQVAPQGSQTESNRKMLSAFRWNLRVLSYIAVLVGAFLIYNTISVSVVRRRPQIGILRALGATQQQILLALLSEAVVYGILGSLLALPLGRLLATGAVRLLSTTVNTLYVSSSPGAMGFSWASLALSFSVGIGVTLAAALSPSLEASRVTPTEAMARGAREYAVAEARSKDLLLAAALALFAVCASKAPPIAGKPFMGYFAALLLIASACLAVPSLVYGVLVGSSEFLKKMLGVEALIASRSLTGSMRRTSVLVCALATAIAMMTSIAIMVGSFRQTVLSWMDSQLPADLYLRPAGTPSADRHPVIAPELAEKLRVLPGVEFVSSFRAYEIDYQGLPITVASLDTDVPRYDQTSGFLSGRSPASVFRELSLPGTAMISEPFANKHHAKTGDIITLPLGAQLAHLRIIDTFSDYANERGYVVLARSNMMAYLHDGAASNLAVYVKPGFDLETVRGEIERASQGREVLIFSNRELRREAIRIFDQTFAITYALEAISILVAVMGIAGALLSIVFDRRREFGLLHYLGATKRQVQRIILAEAGLIGILANIAGLVLGVLLSLILIFVINKQSFGWTIRFHWPVPILLGALSIVYLATVLSGLYPARVAQRLSPIEVIHEE